MSDTFLREKNQITLPNDIVQAAGLSPSDRINWRFEHGEIVGRKLAAQPRGETRLAKDSKTGMLYFDCELSYDELESAALSAPPNLPL
jgi:hypothetical protein